MSDGTVFGLIHGLKDRSRERKIRDAQRNYLTNPQESIMAVNEIDAPTAIKMNESFTQGEAAKRAEAEARRTAESERYTSALRNMTSGLTRVRDDGGDLGGAFDRLTPVMQQAFQMAPEEIGQWREQITSNPQFLDELGGFFNGAKEPAELKSASPGSWVYNPETGEVVQRVPSTPRTVSMRRGDGGYDMYVVDGDGNFIQPQGVSNPPGAAPGNGGGGGGGPQPQRTVDPQARGMRNRNPGNIKDGPWARRQPGYAGNDGTFARFETMEAGTAAQESLLKNHYVNGQRTVTDIVMKYLGGADNPENSTASQRNYVGYVAQRLGLSPGQPVPPEMLSQLGQAMREFENGGQVAGTRAAPQPAASTPGAPQTQEGWRPISQQDRAQYPNLDPNREYQVGIGGANDGQIREVPGQARPKAGSGPNGGEPGKLTTQRHYDTVRNLARVRDEARALINHPSYEQATGSLQGRLPSLRQSTVDFDDKLEAFVSKSVIDTIRTMKQNDPNGATGFGALNASEGNWIKQSGGSFAQSSPEELRRALERHETDAMISIGMAYNIPPEATTFLLQRPATRKQFDAKYGAGMAARILGE